MFPCSYRRVWFGGFTTARRRWSPLINWISFCRFATVTGKMVCGKPSDKWVQDIVKHQKDKAGSG